MMTFDEKVEKIITTIADLENQLDEILALPSQGVDKAVLQKKAVFLHQKVELARDELFLLRTGVQWSIWEPHSPKSVVEANVRLQDLMKRLLVKAFGVPPERIRDGGPHGVVIRY